MLKLTEEELNHTVQRASQIVDQQADAMSSGTADPYEPYLCAAEEVGIPRKAMLQALQERLPAPMESFQPGDIVFARSIDRAFYAATIVRVENENLMRVQFLSGGEHSVSGWDIRPLALVPGCVVQFDYALVAPEMSGIWHKARLLEYDAAKQQARISYGLTSYTLPLTKLRLQDQKSHEPPREPSRVRPLLIRAILVAGSIGGGIGFLLGHFLR